MFSSLSSKVCSQSDRDYLGDIVNPTTIKEFQISQLLGAYKIAKEQGTYEPKEPINTSALVSSFGQLQASFVLPSGKAVGSQFRIGFPNSSAEAHVYRIGYDKETRQFHLFFYVKKKEGEKLK